MEQNKHQVKVLFVCLGNICRSPSAEAVFRAYVERQGYVDRIEIDSAGLIAHHEGEQADRRMQAHARRRGYELTSISRPISYEDFFLYDYIVGMDECNRSELLRRAPTEEARTKISLLTDWNDKALMDHVPDPYYGGAEGFEQVLDLLEDCVPHLLRAITQNTK